MGYQPALEEVRSGRRPFVILDVLQREVLERILTELGIMGVSEDEAASLTRAWHRLDPWPDVVAALQRLKQRHILATLSNGHVALTVNMAKRAGLPWDVILGAELVRAYKPAAEVYDAAPRLLGLEPAQCMMVAAHPSDLDAAAGRGFRTAYVHRADEYGHGGERKLPADGQFDLVVSSFSELADRLA
jgi:2-haloacid dehalogenase